MIKKIFLILIFLYLGFFHKNLICLGFFLDNSNKINIFYTSEFFGKIGSTWVDENLTNIGLDIIKNVKKETENSILISTNDIIQSTCMNDFSDISQIIDIVNLAEYDLMLVNSQELKSWDSQNLEILKKRFTNAKFGLLKSDFNLSNNSIIRSNYIKEISGKRIGFFEIIDDIDIINSQIASLKKQKSDVIIGVSGSDSSNININKIAEKTEGLNIIISNNKQKNENNLINNVFISENSYESSNLGHIELIFKNGNLKINSELIDARDLGKSFVPDISIKKMINIFLDKISFKSDKIVGMTKNKLFGGDFFSKNIPEMFEIPLGDIICDSMVWHAENSMSARTEFGEIHKKMPIVSFENSEYIQKTINRGFISYRDVFDAFPFESSIIAQVLTVKKLYNLLTKNFNKFKFSNFPQVSGIKIEFNSDREKISDLIILDKNSKVLKKISKEDSESKILFLCDSEFLTRIMPDFIGENIYNLGKLRDVFIKYLRKLTLESDFGFKYDEKNRIIISDVKKPNFNAEIILKDELEVLSFRDVFISINNNHAKKFTTDENGKVFLHNLPSGIHRIFVEYNGNKEEIIVSDSVNSKFNVIYFLNKYKYDFSKVANIIGQIPYNISLDDVDFVRFAKNSYDNLNDSDKLKVFNIYKLEHAQRELAKIRGNFIEDLFIKNSNKNILLISLLLIISSISLLVIINYKQKKSLLSRD
ncbi:MAG: 5'-nucleotidase C-terminal domain-containing protein [Candidatus Improbicoccus devescovinae]|nr:MAG: 5'-nucleotidase C-terminal domain-containing protein [Candidatus Improbicoccus devescovinae]